MLGHNKRMKQFLVKHGIKATPKYLSKGSLKGRWRFYNYKQDWTPELQQKLNDLGFRDFDGKPLHRFSGNGGKFMIFAIAPKNINELCFKEF